MNDPRILDAITREQEYIAYLQTLPDKQLQKKLSIIRAQQELAWKQNNEALMLLDVWESQVIEARCIRNEDDSPASSSGKPQKEKIIIEEPVELLNEVSEEIEAPLSKFEEVPAAPTQMALF